MNKMKEMWDARYANPEYAYGTEPNLFFKEMLAKYEIRGKILLPADGEGRNSVFAAKQGLQAYAFDISQEGQNKAKQLAEKEHVNIHYEVGEFYDLQLAKEQFDAAALIYAHFPPPILSAYYQKVAELIKPNGWLILEGFSKGHLEYRSQNPAIGGPDKLEMLFSEEMIARDFPQFEIMQLEDVTVELHEGLYHNGFGKVLRFMGRKSGK